MQKIYRKSIGCVLLNNNNKVFLAKRVNDNLPRMQNPWQMPQGGVEQGETLEQTLFRELREEIGTNNIAILAKSNTVYYDFPPHVAEKLQKHFGSYYCGQEQVWFYCKFLGDDSEFNFKLTNHPEFTEFEWVTPEVAIERAVEFKKDLYKEVFNQAKFLQLV